MKLTQEQDNNEAINANDTGTQAGGGQGRAITELESMKDAAPTRRLSRHVRAIGNGENSGNIPRRKSSSLARSIVLSVDSAELYEGHDHPATSSQCRRSSIFDGFALTGAKNPTATSDEKAAQRRSTAGLFSLALLKNLDDDWNENSSSFQESRRVGRNTFSGFSSSWTNRDPKRNILTVNRTTSGVQDAPPRPKQRFSRTNLDAELAALRQFLESDDDFSLGGSTSSEFVSTVPAFISTSVRSLKSSFKSVEAIPEYGDEENQLSGLELNDPIHSNRKQSRVNFKVDDFNEHLDGSTKELMGSVKESSDRSTSDTSSTDDEILKEGIDKDTAESVESEEEPALTLAQRYALSMAKNPKAHLYSALCFTVLVSAIGMILGDFKLAMGNEGWFTRGTPIANKASQTILIESNRNLLFTGADSDYAEWDDLMDVDAFNAERRGWRTQPKPKPEPKNDVINEVVNNVTVETRDEKWEAVCDGSWYTTEKYFTNPNELNLDSIWRTFDAESKHAAETALSADALYNLCVAEERTLKFLEDNDLCYKCPTESGDGSLKCVQPISLVSMARLDISFSRKEFEFEYIEPSMSCEELREQWTPAVQTKFTSDLRKCAIQFLQDYNISAVEGQTIKYNGDFICPLPQFSPFAVDTAFPISSSSVVKYTASIFAQKNDEESIQKIYDAYMKGEFDVNDRIPIHGEYEVGFNALYTTFRKSFYERAMDSIIVSDVLLCVLCAAVTSICILIHTKSVLLTVVGLLQIILSFPVAYTIYYFVCGITFYPFVNMNAGFVVFALGADDIFVAVDKWKNVRAELGNSSTKQVAKTALPSASFAMFVTSITTACAFFATAVSTVPAMVCFSVFCGLVVTVDYILNILLVFPTLIIFDELMMAGSTSKFLSFEKYRGEHLRKKPLVTLTVTLDLKPTSRYESTLVSSTNVSTTSRAVPTEHRDHTRVESSKEKHIFIHRVFDGYYGIMHNFRWLILILSLAAMCCCGYVASLFRPTDDTDTPILNANHPLEMHRQWSKELLPQVLSGTKSSTLSVIYGVYPTDVGDHLDPGSFTSLVLDESFNPRSEEVQTYMLGACDRLYQNDFVSEGPGSGCAMLSFHEWLQTESTSTISSEEYQNNCEGADSVPVPHEVFDSCIIAWANMFGETSGVLEYHGEVKIIVNSGYLDTSFVSPFAEKEEEVLKFTAWEEEERRFAPAGLNFFVASPEAWWYDTLTNMLNSAYLATGIAVVCAATMIVITSQSISVMIFSSISILYVILAATASLVGLGWTLGLFESILFAILIGIGCDFCLHLGHAYTIPAKDVSKEERTRFALLHMGPSILASGLTTFLTATIMLFTQISYFRQFSVMLIMTVIHSTIGSLVVFLVLCDCFGPSDPTKFFKGIVRKCKKSL